MLKTSLCLSGNLDIILCNLIEASSPSKYESAKRPKALASIQSALVIPSLLDLVWTCSGDFKDDIPCGVCTKCLEWKYAKHVAKKSVYKVQEGKYEI